MSFLQKPNPLCLMATLCVIAHTVDDVSTIAQCLLHSHAYTSGYEVVETLYGVATRLLLFKTLHGVGHAFTRSVDADADKIMTLAKFLH